MTGPRIPPTGISHPGTSPRPAGFPRSRFRVLPALGLLVFLAVFVRPQSSDLDRQLLAGQEAMYRLQYDEARRIFEQVRRSNPDSPVGHGMLAILAFNELLFAAGNIVTEDYATPGPLSKEPTAKPVEQPSRLFHAANEEMLQVAERALLKNQNDPVALYFKGLYHENLAAEAMAITKSHNTAFGQGKKAAKIHGKVQQTEPALVDANVSLAGSEFAKANLPWLIRWMTYLIGMRGDEKKAFERLDLVARQGRYRRLDAELVAAVLHAWKKKPGHARQAVDAFERLRRRFPENYLLDLNLAAIYEQTELNDPRSALRVYEQLLASLVQKAPSLKVGEVHYRIGKTHFRLRNYSEALAAFQRAVASECGEAETVPLAHFHMGRIHEEQGDRANATRCYREVVKFQRLSSIASEVKQARSRL